MSELPPGDKRIPPKLPGVPLAYRASEVYRGRPNSFWWFALRFLIGVVLGCGALGAGFYLVSLTNVGPLFFVPLAVLLAAAIFVVVRYRAFGYVTGILVAGPLVVVGFILLLLILCGRGGHI